MSAFESSLWQRASQLVKRASSLKELSCYGLLTVVQKGAGLLLIPISTRYLSLESYGLLESLLVVFSLCSLLEMSAGALPRFYPECSHHRDKQTLLSSSLLLSCAYGAALALLVFSTLRYLPISLFEPLTLLQQVMVAVIVWSIVVAQPLYMWLRIEGRAAAYLLVVSVQTALQFSLAVYGLKQGWQLNAILSASTTSSVVAMSLALLCCRQQLVLRCSWSLLKQTLRYQSCLVLASLSLFVLHGLDRLLLASHLGPETLARYGVMIKLVEAVALVFGIFEAWWLPKRFTILAQENGAVTVAKVHQWLLMVILALVSGCALLAPWVITRLLPEAYAEGLVWLPMLLLALTAKLATSVLDIGCYLPKSPGWLPKINGMAAVLALALYLLLIPQFGVAGLLATLMLVYGLRLAAFSWLSLRLCPLDYQPKALLACLVPPMMVLGVLALIGLDVNSAPLALTNLLWLAAWAYYQWRKSGAIAAVASHPSQNAKAISTAA
ncbi:lipopolysaccharide biosynthesis protein [Aliagarivorans marinus]|uniref:lipopolysaccharide biosynthesis protein n=1 Tax=Aliagarivorans marinus TaxID=561965 RepID=UPI00040AC428|nr:oligosaccharide flippase family protein [Aliagarivorans marinus]